MVQVQPDYSWVVALPLSVEVQSLFSDIDAPQQSKVTISFPKLCCHDRVFELDKPLDLLLYLDDGVWVCEWSGILSAGCSAEEATLSFCEDFSMLWDEIAQRPDEELTRQAQDTKRCMLSVVKSIR